MSPADRLLRFLAGGPACRETGRRPTLRRIGTHGIARTAFDPAALDGLLAEGLAAVGPAGEIALTGHGARRAEALAPAPARPAPLAETRPGPHGVTATLLVDPAESPLGWLARRRDRDGHPLVAEHEFAAGERLRADWTRAALMPGMGTNWRDLGAGAGGGGARGPVEMTDAALAARRRIDRALTAVGADLAGLLVDVCCFLKGLETVEAERRWPARSGRIVLRIALARLAAHYGLGATARGREGPAATRHWGAAGYRPVVGGAGASSG